MKNIKTLIYFTSPNIKVGEIFGYYEKSSKM